MTTHQGSTGPESEKLTENLRRIEELSQRLVKAFGVRTPANPTLNAPSPDLFAKATQAYWAGVMENPTKLFEDQIQYWTESVRHFIEAQELAVSKDEAAEEEPVVEDRRFAHPMWNKNPFFNYVKQQYFTNAAALEKAVSEAQDLDEKEKQRLQYFTTQIVDMMAPTNFLGTNPEALERAVETDGESLVRGLENLVADMEANNGEMVVRLTDESAFELGKNIASTPGQVIFRNEILELIQYAPTTDEVYEVPLVIFPPWINKFYILDLKAQNSLVRWLTEQGYTVFVVSWFNPGKAHARVGLETYIEDGYLQAIDVAKTISGQKQVNVVGYCIAGTTLALALSLMKERGDTSIKSATFFTALTDFSDQGEFTPFLQDDFIDGIEAEVEKHGYLRSFIMARTFSFLRARDLIYTPAVRSYMMGEAPPAFDLLYWNGDGTNLPGKMSMQYLRGLCQQNRFVQDGFELLGQTLHVRDVEVPLFAVTCEKDHIAAWKDCYRGVQQMGSKDKTFIVSESGHIAGIVNAPTKDKYGHYTNADLSPTASDWLAGAEFHKGSWWPRWDAWLMTQSGGKTAARTPGDTKDYPALCPAPGTYVTCRATQSDAKLSVVPASDEGKDTK